jgi:hypothetical protein
MKHWLLFILVELVTCGAWGQTTNIPGGSETIGIYIVKHPSFPGMGTDKNLESVELASGPILSDNDFVAWDAAEALGSTSYIQQSKAEALGSTSYIQQLREALGSTSYIQQLS